MPNNPDSAKVAIVGCGKVGMTAAFTMLIQGIADELVLVGRHKDDIIGEELDLEHGMNFLQPTKILATEDYADIAESDVVVITAGAAQEPGQTRLDLAANNKKILESILPDVLQHAPEAVILLVSNPVDVLVQHAYKVAPQLRHGQVFGSGTTLDTARFRFHLSETLHVNSRSIHAYILGEHGDTSFPVLSSATVGGQPLLSLPDMNEEVARAAYEKAKGAAYTIIQSKGATFYAIGVVISHIVKTILHDTKSVLPVSIPLQNYLGVSDIALSVPCVVGRDGVERVIDLPLSTAEIGQLHASAEALRQFAM